MNNPLRVRSRWSLLRRLLASIQKKSPQPGTAVTADTAEQQDHYDHNPLLDLPNELVLTVASFLDQESQLLLSLSCRRLRVLLNSHLDMALSDDRATKVRFLQLLELDHPEYLTCRSCGLLYLWRKMEFFQYDCPRANHHLVADILVSCGQFIQAGDNKYVWVRRGVVDLILRAYEHGPSHGLPVSFLNMSGHDHHGVSRTNEARLVDGQLILASRMEVEAESGLEVEVMARLFLPNICLHLCATAGVIDKIWQTFEQAVASMIVGSEKSEGFKCPFCETDHQVHVKKTAGNRARIVLNVWRNYGRRYGNRLSTEQVFHRDPALRLDADTVSQRDVRAAFESKTGCIPSMET